MVEGDIRDLETCRTACEGADYVLHHAALGSVPWSMDDPLRTNAVNVDGFINMLVAAKDAGVKRFVYASSSAVYGDTADYPQVEQSLGRPLSPYAASKTTNETYAVAFQMSYGLRVVGLRYFNVFGRRQDPAGAYAAVIPRWIASLLRGGFEVEDRPRLQSQQRRDRLQVVLHAMVDLLREHAAHDGTAVLECDGRMMRDRLALNDPRLSVAVPQYDPFRPGDIRFSCASIEKARKMLSFDPTHDVDQGLAEALDWYVERARAGVVQSPAPHRHGLAPSIRPAPLGTTPAARVAP